MTIKEMREQTKQRLRQIANNVPDFKTMSFKDINAWFDAPCGFPEFARTDFHKMLLEAIFIVLTKPEQEGILEGIRLKCRNHYERAASAK